MTDTTPEHELAPIVVSRFIKASPAKVFAHLTESSAWALWQGKTAQIEAEPGGIFRMEMPNGLTARGQFVELIEDTRVVFTWGWIDNPGVPPGSSVVTINLEDRDGGTLVTLEHRDLIDESIDDHHKGWIYYLGRLDTVASGGNPGPDTGS